MREVEAVALAIPDVTSLPLKDLLTSGDSDDDSVLAGCIRRLIDEAGLVQEIVAGHSNNVH